MKGKFCYQEHFFGCPPRTFFWLPPQHQRGRGWRLVGAFCTKSARWRCPGDDVPVAFSSLPHTRVPFSAHCNGSATCAIALWCAKLRHCNAKVICIVRFTSGGVCARNLTPWQVFVVPRQFLEWSLIIYRPVLNYFRIFTETSCGKIEVTWHMVQTELGELLEKMLSL